MANHYHDENGRFCSKGEMQSAIQRTAAAGDYKGMWALKDSMAKIEKDAGVKVLEKEVTAPVKATRQRKKFFADDDVLDRRSVSKNVNTSVEELTQLSKDKDSLTRGGVGTNPSTPVSVLTRLAKDKDWGVRFAVAKNPHTPVEVVETLSNDSNSWVREEAKKNLPAGDSPRTLAMPTLLATAGLVNELHGIFDEIKANGGEVNYTERKTLLSTTFLNLDIKSDYAHVSKLNRFLRNTQAGY